MKKLIFTTILTLLGISVLISCTGESKRGERLTTMLSVEASQDLIDVCDIEIIYKGKGGVNMVDTITKTEWHKIVVNDSFPTKIGVVTMRYLVKPGFKPSKKTYDLSCNDTVLTKEVEREIPSRCFELFDVPADKVASFLELYNIFNKDDVKNDADSSVYTNVITVIKVKDKAAKVPFVFNDQLRSEEPVVEEPLVVELDNIDTVSTGN